MNVPSKSLLFLFGAIATTAAVSAETSGEVRNGSFGEAEAGGSYEPLRVKVMDSGGKPVKDADVIFVDNAGEGILKKNPNPLRSGDKNSIDRPGVGEPRNFHPLAGVGGVTDKDGVAQLYYCRMTGAGGSKWGPELQFGRSGIIQVTTKDHLTGALDLHEKPPGENASELTITVGQPSLEKIQTEKAAAFLKTLTSGLLKKATYSLTSDERENWHFIPKDRNGVEFKELDESQKKAAMVLLHSALSEKGTMKAEAIMALEAVLAGIENNPTLRDAGHYHVTVFGTPGEKTGWGWRFEGHHISINMTLKDGHCAVTPTFLGSNPGEVRVEGPQKGKRALAAEEDDARLLASALAEAGKKVVFSEKPPGEILTSNERKVSQLEIVGVPVTEMTEVQELLLQQLLGEYIDRYKAELAAEQWKKLRDAGLEKINFGWAGGLKPGEAFYYRIQGPTFLIETANVQNNANHMHTVWRDFNGDFGRDLLGEHYKEDR